MGRADQTLMEQMKITGREIAERKKYLNFTESDVDILAQLKPVIMEHVDHIVDDFYSRLLTFDEMDRIIGDAETLSRLKNYQRQYIIALFDGEYHEEYVHSRLRVGVVHRRIGVPPKLYISAVHHMKRVVGTTLTLTQKGACSNCEAALSALDKIIMFDLSLIIDTYIESLMEETRHSKSKLSEYVETLEDVVAQRTRKLKQQARHDGLTGLLNQTAFYRELKRELSRSSRLRHPVTLLLFDLDKFKQLNDTKGHKAGDEALMAVARVVGQEIREIETSARYGGDEFCIILPESTAKNGETVAKRLCRSLEKALDGTNLGCSIGIVDSLPEDPLDADSMVRLADKAMYRAKKKAGFSFSVAEAEDSEPEGAGQ